MRDQKGITLVALVVTIIVLLILAGVTMALVLGQDGIFTKAGDAKTATANSDFLSSVKLSMLNIKVDSYDSNGTDAGTYPATPTAMATKIVDDLKKGDYASAKLTAVDSAIISNGKTGNDEVQVTITGTKDAGYTAAVTKAAK